jgi:opacity protein-like surface antigen
MKKNILIISLLSLFVLPVTTKAQAFDDKVNLISLGFGLPPGDGVQNSATLHPNFTDYHITNYGTGVLKYEHGLHKYFGIGLNFEYSAAASTYKYDDQNTLRYQVNNNRQVYGGYLRMNGHYPIGEHFDVYAGVGLGYLSTIDKYTDTNPSANNSNHKNVNVGFDYQLSLGARFMVKKGFGLFAEVGKASTICQLGIVFRF